MTFESHDSRVEKCLAEIIGRREQETETEAKLLGQAEESRSFFINMGRALSAAIPPIDGQWNFPFGVMRLALVSDTVRGTVDIERKESGFGMLLYGSSGISPNVKHDRYEFEGKMKGGVCEFTVTIAEKNQGVGTVLGGLPSKKSGFIVFESDGRSAAYVVLSNEKIGKPEQLSKLELSSLSNPALQS